MTQYDVNFGKTLADVATQLALQSDPDESAMRAVAYLSLLSMEISLKSFLEQSGVQVKRIRDFSHSIGGLLDELGNCEVEVGISPDFATFVSASRLRSVVVSDSNASVTVGEIIERSQEHASAYPNQIRYGAQIVHFQPKILALAARKVADFVASNWSSCRLGHLRPGTN